jgi:hypothetical protein
VEGDNGGGVCAELQSTQLEGGSGIMHRHASLMSKLLLTS